MGDECEVMGEHHSTVNKYTSEQLRIIIIKYMNINLKTTGCPTFREIKPCCLGHGLMLSCFVRRCFNTGGGGEILTTVPLLL